MILWFYIITLYLFVRDTKEVPWHLFMVAPDTTKILPPRQTPRNSQSSCSEPCEPLQTTRPEISTAPKASFVRIHNLNKMHSHMSSFTATLCTFLKFGIAETFIIWVFRWRELYQSGCAIGQKRLVEWSYQMYRCSHRVIVSRCLL